MPAMRPLLTLIVCAVLLSTAAGQPETFDAIIRGGMVYDGSGSPGGRSDVGIRRDRVVAVRDL
jgi:N-acyl-D-amino-acid deacylase